MSLPRLLYVDDDPDLRALVPLALDGWFEVRTAGSAPEALDAVAAAPVDAVLSDMQMPGMDGGALLAALRARGLDLPVVVLTGRRDACPEGAAGVLAKPFDPCTLGLQLSALLSGH